jgi:long-chain acyl-CoA synthetase
MARMTHVLGGAVHVMRKFDAEEALRLMAELGITTTFMVPTMLRRIVNLPPALRRAYDVSSLRCILTGATAVSFGLKQQVVEHFGNHCLFESYGSTEVGLATIMVPHEQLRRPGSCGRLLAGVSARILDPDGKELPCGQLGEIYIAGPELVANYLNEGPHGEDVAKQGYFSAGDLGRLDQDGFLYIVDRKNDMIISGGVNIHPSEIEAVLGQHPAVLEAAVFGIPNPDFGEEVKAVCEVVAGQSVSADELLAFARDRLADYKRPRSIDFVEQLPRNPAEKILKRELRQPYWGEAGKET